MDFNEQYKQTCDAVLSELGTALGRIDPQSVRKLLDAILAADQVFSSASAA